MERLLGSIAISIGMVIQPRNDDDIMARLSHRYTTFLLALCAILVSTKQYVGEPINCWVPAQFTDNHEDYANKVCWVSNTYYIPFKQRIPNADAPREMIGYYQWVPLIMLLQAAAYYLPVMIWRWFSFGSGIDCHDIIMSAKSLQNICFAPEREKNLRYLTGQLGRFLNQHRIINYYNRNHDSALTKLRNVLARKFFCGKAYGNYLVLCYVLVKFLYALNACVQLFILDIFIGNDYYMYGFQVIRGLIKNENWESSPKFPRVTLCDFEVRHLGGNLHRHTVQCVLPINLFHEKIYILIWFWFTLLALISVLSMFTWFWRCFCLWDGTEYIFTKLINFQKVSKMQKKRVSDFVTKYLRHDGVFVIRLIEINVNSLMAGEITTGMWENFDRGQNSIQYYKRHNKNNQAIDV